MKNPQIQSRTRTDNGDLWPAVVILAAVIGYQVAMVRWPGAAGCLLCGLVAVVAGAGAVDGIQESKLWQLVVCGLLALFFAWGCILSLPGGAL